MEREGERRRTSRGEREEREARRSIKNRGEGGKVG